jgi:hypothetical protein
MQFKKFFLFTILFLFQGYLYSDPLNYFYNDFTSDLRLQPVTFSDTGRVQYTFLPSNSFLVQSNAVNSSPPSSKDKDTVQRRRSMLEWHQITGFATWGFWLATNIAGEQAKDSYRKEYEPLANIVLLSNPAQNGILYYAIMDSSPWESKSSHGHEPLAAATFLLYGATAGLSFLSPSKLQADREEGWSSIFTHKAMIFIHLPSMIGLAALGPQIETGGPKTLQQMQNVGWLGFGALTVAIATFYF